LGAAPPFARVFAASLAIDFGFMTTPAGIGGYAASVYCARRSGISLSAATTLTAVDQLLDLAFFTLALPIAAAGLLWSDLPPLLVRSAFGASALTIALAIVAVVLRRRLVAWLLGDNAFVRRWPSLKRKQHHLREFGAGLKADGRLLASGGPRWLAAICFLTAAQWLTRYGVLWAALILLGHAVPFALVLLSQSLILHAAMWTGIPSGGGSAELGLTAALLSLVPTETIAGALLLWRIITFYVCLLAGLVAIAYLARRGHGGPAPASDGMPDRPASMPH
ncbi:MAG TPA: lysylphosphatidylglycerol synthase transmembrane domain-containing protein, partial [Rudaea sp.]